MFFSKRAFNVLSNSSLSSGDNFFLPVLAFCITYLVSALVTMATGAIALQDNSEIDRAFRLAAEKAVVTFPNVVFHRCCVGRSAGCCLFETVPLDPDYSLLHFSAERLPCKA